MRMPNHIYNIVTMKCPHEQAQTILNEVQDDHYGIGSIDFEKLIPMPDDVYRGPLGSKEMKEYPGEKNWYNWSINHWGTKWPAYGTDELPAVEDSLVFQTAWSSVPIVIRELSHRYPDISMEYSWADEDFGSNTGMIEFKGGDAVSVYIPEDQSPEAYEFAAALQGCSIEDFGFVRDPKTGDIHFNDEVFQDKAPDFKPKERGEER